LITSEFGFDRNLRWLIT